MRASPRSYKRITGFMEANPENLHWGAPAGHKITYLNLDGASAYDSFRSPPAILIETHLRTTVKSPGIHSSLPIPLPEPKSPPLPLRNRFLGRRRKHIR